MRTSYGLPAAIRGATPPALALFAALWTGCASAPPIEEVPSAETYYSQGLEVLEGRRVLFFFRDVDEGRAIELFQEVIDNYPYSEYATLAELKIADVYFEKEDWEQAASYYQDFVELHPRHDRVPYAIWRNGLCASSQIRAVDRDQEPTVEAIAQFEVLLARYPDSEYAPAAREKVGEARERLAEHGIYVGDYYMKRQECHSAARRYLAVLRAYPQHANRTQTMLRLATALGCANLHEEAIPLLGQILAENPSSELREQVEQELRALGASFRARSE